AVARVCHAAPARHTVLSGAAATPPAYTLSLHDALPISLGAASKANHLSYLGDASVGSGVNVGAGTITCNFDGERKHQTVIEDGGSEEHTSELQSRDKLVCRLLLGKKKKQRKAQHSE